MTKTARRTHHFTCYAAADYWVELQKCINKTTAGDRIALATMSFDPSDPVVHLVIQKAQAAAERGVRVQLIVDAHTFLIHSRKERLGPLWWRGHLRRVPALFRDRLAAIQEMDSTQFGHATIINTPKRALSNPVAGRSHIKFSVVNNKVFVGGCNLECAAWLDVMVGWDDAYIADYLYNFATDLAVGGSTQTVLQGQDRRIPVDAQTTLFIDAGVPGQSLILRQALELIDSAQKSIFITCQFFPNSITAKHLAAAHKRGVHVEIVYGHPSHQGRIGGLGQRVSIARERVRVPTELFSKGLSKDTPLLHAKVLVTDQAAMVGSHNYVRAGVRLGTAEMALLRYDSNFAKQAVSAIRTQLKSNKAI